MMEKHKRSFWLQWGLLVVALFFVVGIECKPIPIPPREPEPPCNEPPRIRSLTANPTSVEPGGTSRVTVSASDPEGGRLRYSWTATGGTVSPRSGRSPATTWTAPQTPGTYSVTVTVRDGEGNRTRRSVNITVAPRPNRPPALGSLTVAPSSVEPGGTSRVTVIASDPDGDALTYSWTATGGNVLPRSNNPSVTWTAPQRPGTYSVTVTVRDNRGGSTSRLVTITVTAPLPPPPPAARDNIGIEEWQEVPPE